MRRPLWISDYANPLSRGFLMLLSSLPSTLRSPQLVTFSRISVFAGVLAALGAGVLAAQQGPRPTPSPAAPLVLSGVTVVDVEAGTLVPGQTVVVSGNRIQRMGRARDVQAPKGAQVVDAQGKYLIPGLWDMHMHLRSDPERIYSLLIANGVTGARQMSDVGAAELRRGIMAGERIGPRVVVTQDIEAQTVDASHRKIDAAKAAGIDFVKVHSVDGMSRDDYTAITTYAKQVGMRFVGHLPNTITEVDAADAGQQTVEHFNEIHCWWPDGERFLGRKRSPATYPAPDSAGIQRCTEVAKAFARNGTWLVPTLVLTYMSEPNPRMTDYARYWPKSVRARLLDMTKNCCQAEPTAQRAREVLPLMHRAGIPLLAGTDAVLHLPIAHGFSLHDELGIFVDVGLSPLEALRTATLNPAKHLRATDSLGTVATGKVADLVLLDADPLTDIANTRKIRAVVANGRYFDRATLDSILADIAQKMEEN